MNLSSGYRAKTESHARNSQLFMGVRAFPRDLESLVWIDRECSLQGADEEPRSRVYPWSGCSRATAASEQGSLVLVKNVIQIAMNVIYI